MRTQWEVNNLWLRRGLSLEADLPNLGHQPLELWAISVDYKSPIGYVSHCSLTWDNMLWESNLKRQFSMNLCCRGLKCLNPFFTDSLLGRDCVWLYILRNLNDSDLSKTRIYFSLTEQEYKGELPRTGVALTKDGTTKFFDILLAFHSWAFRRWLQPWCPLWIMKEELES